MASKRGMPGQDQAATADALGFAPFVTAVHKHLADPHSKPPLTLSVEGDWGSGKSSFMLQLRDKIREENPEDYVVWFNAWRHDKDESVWAAFAVEFVRQLNHEIWRRCNWRNRWFFPWLRSWIRNRSLVKRLAKCGLVKWLRRRLLVKFVGWAIEAVNPLNLISVTFWGWSRLRIATRLSLQRFDWDKGLQDVLKTAFLFLPWLALLAYGLWAWCVGSGDKVENVAQAATQAVPGDVDASNWPKLAEVFLPVRSSILGAVGILLTLAYKFTGNPLRYDLRKYARGPNYQDKVAFIERFHADFSKVVSVMAGERKIYVFIDDLDRCDVPKAADLMQALNLMIPDDSDPAHLRLVFILGLDREKVSAGLAVKFKDLLPYLGSPAPADENETEPENNRTENTAATASKSAALSRQERAAGVRFGHSFIEKFIQLPFLVPRPRTEDLDRFVEDLFLDDKPTTPAAEKPGKLEQKDVGDASRVADRGGAEPAERVDGPDTQTDARAGGEGVPVDVDSQLATSTPPQCPHDEREAWDAFFDDPKEKLRELVLMVAPAFGYNPRTMKQFMNLFRLRARIWDEVCTQTAGTRQVPHICMEQLAKFVAISLRWPLLVSLGQRRAESGGCQLRRERSVVSHTSRRLRPWGHAGGRVGSGRQCLGVVPGCVAW